MSAVGLRVGRWLRSTARASALLVVTLAAVASVVLAITAGARRTGSAPDRYDASRDDALDVLANQDDGRPLTDAVARLPAARVVQSMTFVFGALTSPDGSRSFDSLVFSGSPVPSGDRLVAGRTTDPRRPGEFVASRGFATENGLSIGDELRLITLTPEQAAESGFQVPKADGPTIDATLVGLIDGPSDLSDPSAIAVFPRSLIDGGRIGTSGTVMAIGLRPGQSIEQLREQLDTIPQGDLLRLQAASPVSSETRSAVRTQALGLWLLAVMGAVAVVAALGQMLMRHVRLSADESLSLSSVGYSRFQVVGEAAARASVITAVALALACGVAVVGSGIFPFGFVHRIEPEPGLHIDSVALFVGAPALAIALVAWVVVMTGVRRPKPGQHHPAAVDSVATRLPSAAMGTGFRFAFTSRDSASLAVKLAGMAVMVAAVVGTFTFAVSVQRLVGERARYGANYEYLIDSGADQVPETLLAGLLSDPDVAAVTLITSTQARVVDTGSTLALDGMERVRGVLDPELLAGRLPASPEEIALGRVSGRDLHVSIGDQLRLSKNNTEAEYTITGLIVPQLISGNDLVGQGAVVTVEGYARLDPEAPPNAASVRLRADAAPDAAKRIADAVGVTPDQAGPSRPPAILNIARTTFVPFVLAALLAILVALSFISAVYAGVRRHDHQVGVLRSMGVNRRWLTRAVRSQACAFTLVPVALGVPLGIIAGRLVFRAYADSLGTLPDAAVPLGWVAAGLGVLLAFATATATMAGRPARLVAPAQLLRAE